MKKWFKVHKYGYGFYPASWQGVLAIGSMVGAIGLSAYTNGLFDDIVETKMLVQFLLDALIIIGISILLLKKKIDGDLRWRWGNQDQ
jgi:hypothetical protein